MKPYPNISKLGKKQTQILTEMCQGSTIKRFEDDSNGDIDILLQDRDGNAEEYITDAFLESLRRRKLFVRSDIRPSLNIYVSEWKIKKELKEELYLYLTGKHLTEEKCQSQ